MTVAIRATDLVKSYTPGSRALDGVSLEVSTGEVLVVMGPSGSGKSTLIRTFNGLEPLDAGELDVLGIRLDAAHEERPVREIRRRVGMVFQQFNLFPHLSILDNITLAPVKVQKRSKGDAEQRAIELLDQMGIQEQAHKFPAQLSGGQQQRVAIARSLAKRPRLLLGDELTGNLDSKTSAMVMEVLVKACEAEGITCVFVTHDESLIDYATRIVRLDSGRIISDSTPVV